MKSSGTGQRDREGWGEGERLAVRAKDEIGGIKRVGARGGLRGWGGGLWSSG